MVRSVPERSLGILGSRQEFQLDLKRIHRVVPRAIESNRLNTTYSLRITSPEVSRAVLDLQADSRNFRCRFPDIRKMLSYNLSVVLKDNDASLSPLIRSSVTFAVDEGHTPFNFRSGFPKTADPLKSRAASSTSRPSPARPRGSKPPYSRLIALRKDPPPNRAHP